VPETLRGLWSQRLRWAQGGIEVFRRQWDVWTSWKYRRIWPVYLEQVLAVMLLIIILLAIITFLVMYSWAKYNYKRFGHLDRRKTPPEVSDGELAAVLGTTSRTVCRARKLKVAVLTTSACGISITDAHKHSRFAQGNEIDGVNQLDDGTEVCS
jgi:hypothetical protein